MTALERERFCHHGDGQGVQFGRERGDDRRGASPRPTAQSDGDEDHVGAFQGFENLFCVLERGVAPDFRVCACAQPFRQPRAKLQFYRRLRPFQRLEVRVRHKELNAFDGVVFDPPRAGAEDQSKQIARSDVPYVVAVSCNPATLARDLRILLDGGYALKSVTPVDQFLWSPHVEAVALLEKPRRRR